MARSFLAASLAAGLLLGLAPAVAAKTYPLGLRQRIATVAIPDAWQVDDVDRGLTASTKEQEVMVWLEVYNAASLDALMAEHRAYFAAQKVAETGKPQTTTLSAAGLTAAVMTIPATWDGSPTTLKYFRVDLGLPSGENLLLTYWATPEDEPKFAADFKSILDSLAAMPPKPGGPVVEEYYLREAAAVGSDNHDAEACLKLERRGAETYVSYQSVMPDSDELLIIEPTRARAAKNHHLVFDFTDNGENVGRGDIALKDMAAALELKLVKRAGGGGSNLLRQYPGGDELPRRPCE